MPHRSEENLRVTNTGKGWYDTISSDTGFEEGVHNWKVKVLKIHPNILGSVCFGVISKTNWARKREEGDDFFWTSKAGISYSYYEKDDKGMLRKGGKNITTSLKENIPCIYAGESIRIELNCEKKVIKVWKIKKGENSTEESLGELKIETKRQKWYPAMMAFASQPADFRLIFD